MYECSWPGCSWQGSRSGRSKHFRREHGRTVTEAPAAPSEPSPDPGTAGPRAEDHLNLTVTLRSGSSYSGSLPRIDSGGLMTRPILESTRISQGETLHSESESEILSDNNDPDWGPHMNI